MMTQSVTMNDVVINTLEDMKAIDIVIIDVKKLTTVTDYMVVCSGNSARHVKSIAKNLSNKAKEKGFRPIGMEGEEDAEWILVDLGDMIIHIMQPVSREFYSIERLWQGEHPEASQGE